jgi:hypothetical protein
VPLRPGGGRAAWARWAPVPSRPRWAVGGGPPRIVPDVESISLAEEKMQCAARSAGREAPLRRHGVARHLGKISCVLSGLGALVLQN